MSRCVLMRDSASALHRPLFAAILVVVGLAPPLIAGLRGPDARPGRRGAARSLQAEPARRWTAG
jgi:hypothetical protein